MVDDIIYKHACGDARTAQHISSYILCFAMLNEAVSNPCCRLLVSKTGINFVLPRAAVSGPGWCRESHDTYVHIDNRGVISIVLCLCDCYVCVCVLYVLLACVCV
jgi:hypothetical protein